MPIFAADLVVVVAVPFAIWLALRARGAVASLVLLTIGVGVPWLWAPLIPSSGSAPLHVMTTLAILSGTLMAVGGLLMLPTSRPGPDR